MHNGELAALLEGFFKKRLISQRRVSPHTIASYRDTFRLLLSFAQQRLKLAPSKMGLADLNAPFLTDFLESLERARSNKARTRNLRLTAIRSFLWRRPRIIRLRMTTTAVRIRGAWGRIVPLR